LGFSGSYRSPLPSPNRQAPIESNGYEVYGFRPVLKDLFSP